jgi:sugar lactone lactonase YvrE
MKALCCASLILLSFALKGQVINTVAGNGTNNNSGDNGPAINAGIYQPSWIIFDKKGNYYIVSGQGHKIRKVDTSGIITTVAGTGVGGYNGEGGLADTSKLNGPSSIVLDSAGNLYIADAMNNRIRKVDITTGIISTVAGDGTQGFSGDNYLASQAQLNGPDDVCFDKLGNLYISDAGNHRIRKVNQLGIITTYAGNGNSGNGGDGGPALMAELSAPRGIAVGSDKNLYIADWSGNRVRKVDTNGVISTIAGNGAYIYNGDNIAATAANMSPVRVAFDNMSNLFITDFYNNRIREVDANGIIYTIAGNGVQAFSGDGGPANSASLNGPSGITFDSCGNLYITEVNQGRIRKVTFHPNCFSESVNEVGNVDNIKVYPNPTNDILTITGKDVKSAVILNVMGQVLIEQKNYKTNKAIINVSSLASGVYFVKIRDKYGAEVVKRFVKE